MTVQFKVGDKVVRTGENTYEGVEEGKTYTVVDVHNNWLKLEGFEEWGCGFNPKYFEAAPKWNPQIGDTIVCENGTEYICEGIFPATERGWAFCGKRSSIQCYRWQGWYSNGSPNKSGERCAYGYDIAKIIPKGQPKEVQSNSTSPDNLEFRIRVLEKENELLTRLLLKGGLL